MLSGGSPLSSAVARRRCPFSPRLPLPNGPRRRRRPPIPQSSIADLHFPSTVLSVRLNRDVLAVVLERRVVVHALRTLQARTRSPQAPASPAAARTRQLPGRGPSG